MGKTFYFFLLVVWMIATELPKEEEWADPSWCRQGGIVGTQSELMQDSRLYKPLSGKCRLL